MQPNAFRLKSIDALRGFDMFCLLIVGRVVRALGKQVPDESVQLFVRQFIHPDWEGFTFYDLIFPLFEFLIGISVLLSVTRRLARGDSKASILGHALLRVLVMVFLGTWVDGGLLTYDPARFTLTYSVLQMLAIAYFIATLFVLFTGLRGQLLGFVLLLVGYWALQTFVPLPAEPRVYESYSMGRTIEAPAHQPGVYLPGSTFSFWLDEQVFGDLDKWKVGWILKSMTHGCTALLGVFAAHVLCSSMSQWRKTALLTVLGAVCLAAGWGWGQQFPIIKNIWSSSFVLWAGGWSFLLLAGFSGIIDGLHWERWAFPFEVVGANSILAYMMHAVFNSVPAAFASVLLRGLEPYVGDWYGVVIAVGTGTAAWLALLMLYRARVFVRI